ncbi:hypothetical protein C1752_06383 [Acaryochloris thomasi RCC1774]|uniref:PEP-CTERM protein-sorting domain-containing protein n=1 Tax=Acaryochloris thomasi RCC1774 TaxID=1764569 RepID=A0A2W1JC13_9CYAN|nr:hypothetical protein [Acaryochloris thomasi]PZD71438.1 hypothetical protein C1752_06383 [Acaryochloris thomasi RCC1774]
MRFKTIWPRLLLMTCVVLSGGVTSEAANAASIGYITGTSEAGGGAGNPWDNAQNDQALNVAFGEGNWDKLSFGNAVQDGIFTPSTYQVLYVDGGDSLGGEFRGFLDENRGSLESWVADGGSLFLNAARNTSPAPIDLGFGATLINDAFSDTAAAVDPNHPIFNGPVGLTGSSFSGFSFSHDYVTGTDIAPLINDSLGQAVLAEQRFDSGLVLFGGLTTTNFQNPKPEVIALRANILDYAAIEAGLNPTPGPLPEVPEDPRMSLLPILLISGALLGRSYARSKNRAVA